MGRLLIACVAATALALQEGSAEDLWRQGDRPGAIEVLGADLARRPEDAELRRRLVACELEVHWYARALEHMEGLDGAEVAQVRGLALYRLGRLEEALEHLSRTDGEQLLMRLDALETLGRDAELDGTLEVAAKTLGGDHVAVLAWRGRRAAREGEDARAIELFRRALAGDPHHAEAMFGLGRALVRSGRRAEGLAVLEEHRALVPKLDALQFALQSLDLSPRHAPNHAVVGDAERALGRLDRAEAAYRTAARLAEPDQRAPIALRHARLIAEDRGDVDGACELLEALARGAPDPRLWVRAGDLLAAAGRPLDALERYAEARLLRPDDPAIRERVEAARRAARGGGR